VYLLDERLIFPPVELAGTDGLLAIGGDLSLGRLLLAYRQGIFPWYNEGEPIVWYSPDPRMVLYPAAVKISKSMQKVMQSGAFSFTENTCFEQVISSCKSIARPGQEGTWITTAMHQAYIDLHRAGHAKSVEVWQDGELVGGLYGVDLGRIFCGESMFSKVSNASKAALIYLAKKLEMQNYQLIDCQVYNAHLESMGAIEMPRSEFVQLLREHYKGDT
jgi:leucyl/phenylalanyl-tRNA--protein transferase